MKGYRYTTFIEQTIWLKQSSILSVFVEKLSLHYDSWVGFSRSLHQYDAKHGKNWYVTDHWWWYMLDVVLEVHENKINNNDVIQYVGKYVFFFRLYQKLDEQRSDPVVPQA